jgi:hypothetical protein
MVALPTINQLMFKGTHNSYQCTGGTNPIMNHPPDVQIDAFGGWGLELDVGVERDAVSGWVSVVGHNGPGNGICAGWGFRLTDFLISIRDAKALNYRPVFIYLETKDGDDWITADDSSQCNDFRLKYAVALEAFSEVFPGRFIELYDFLNQRAGQHPTVAELVGKVIIYYPLPQFSPGGAGAFCGGAPPFQGTLLSTDYDDCQKTGFEGTAPQVCRMDQYQADWTFDYGVPPNPLIVDSTATPPYPAPTAVGDDWDCDNGDVAYGEVVGEQGTYQFPYKSIGRAVTRAEGTTPNGVREPMRAGYGWTVLIKPGRYLESIRIDTPLILRKDDSLTGTVTIVGQPGRIVSSLWITFRTRDDDKNNDTGLVVRIVGSDGRLLAAYQQRRQKEYQNFYTHTEQLTINGPVFSTEMTGATLTIDIAPSGDDTWRFDWEVAGAWNDGSVFSDRGTGVELTQDRRHFEKILNLQASA